MSCTIPSVSQIPGQSTVTPSVFIVDSDASVRESLEVTIRSAGWRPQAAASAEEFLAQPRWLAPCCVLIELRLRDASGLHLQRLIEDRTEMPVIFMSADGNIPAAVEAMKAGAIEFLTKPLARNTLIRAIDEAIDRSRARLHLVTRIIALKERYESLSVRQRQVMALVVAGRLNKQVGVELGISEITVKAHRGKVMRKMHARSLAELVSISASLQSGVQSRLVHADDGGKLVGHTRNAHPTWAERRPSRTRNDSGSEAVSA